MNLYNKNIDHFTARYNMAEGLLYADIGAGLLSGVSKKADGSPQL